MARQGVKTEVIARRTMVLPGGLPVLEVLHRMGTGTIGQSRKVFAVVDEQGFLIDAETNIGSWPDMSPAFDRIIKSFTLPVTAASASQRPAWEQEMARARRLAAAGQVYILLQVKPAGILVLHTNSRPFCYM